MGERSGGMDESGSGVDEASRGVEQEIGGEETVGTGLIRLLREHEVEVFFGIPGVHTLELFRGVATAPGARHVLNRSELGAVNAADGYARVSGRPGVALLISGPGLTMAATAVAQAYHDSIPLLILSTVVPTPQLGRQWGALHELPDQRATMDTITAYSEHVEDPAQLPAALARAFEVFEGGRPRPVHIQVPADLLEQPMPPLRAAPVRAERPAPAPEDLKRAAELIAGSSTPMMLLGGGAVDAGPEAVALAARIGAPIALSLNAKGAVSDDEPLSLSTTLPSDATIEAISAADLVIAVGTELSEVDRYYADAELKLGQRSIRVDLDPGQLQAQFPAEVGLAGDAAAVLRALDRELDGPGRPDADGAGRAEAIRRRVSWWERARPLMPLVEAIGAALPEDAMVAADSTQLAYIGQNAWPARRPRSWLIPSGFGTLGPALPLAIGAAAAAPERPSFCVIGDGGLLYTIGEMATPAALDQRVIMLLWNNEGYGEIRDEYDLAGIPHVGVDAHARDYQALARGFGWAGVRPADLDQVGAEIGAALDRRGPTVIELTPEILA